MIAALITSILIEGIIVAGYALWHRKPLKHLLFSSTCANLVTQSLLWLLLNLFPNHYLTTLFIAEVSIWGIEGAILHFYRPNRLGLRQALALSLVMNLTSFAIGWFLPV